MAEDGHNQSPVPKLHNADVPSSLGSCTMRTLKRRGSCTMRMPIESWKLYNTDANRVLEVGRCGRKSTLRSWTMRMPKRALEHLRCTEQPHRFGTPDVRTRRPFLYRELQQYQQNTHINQVQHLVAYWRWVIVGHSKPCVLVRPSFQEPKHPRIP